MGVIIRLAVRRIAAKTRFINLLRCKEWLDGGVGQDVPRIR